MQYNLHVRSSGVGVVDPTPSEVTCDVGGVAADFSGQKLQNRWVSYEVHIHVYTYSCINKYIY